MNGTVVAICISPLAGAPMQAVQRVFARAGAGLDGDRYSAGVGSFNKKKLWWEKIPVIRSILKKKQSRQVTLMNALFFENSGFDFEDSRRNIFVEGTELMWLVGREFKIGEAVFRGIKYCDPCGRPDKLSGKTGFVKAFHDRGGLVAEVIKSGWIESGSLLIPPPKGY